MPGSFCPLTHTGCVLRLRRHLAQGSPPGWKGALSPAPGRCALDKLVPYGSIGQSPSSLRPASSLGVAIAVLFYLSWQMALLVTVLLLAQSVAIWLLALGKLRRDRRGQGLAGELNGFVVQVLGGLAKLRVAKAESYALDRWAHQYGDWRRERLPSENRGAAAQAFMAAAQPSIPPRPR